MNTQAANAAGTKGAQSPAELSVRPVLGALIMLSGLAMLPGMDAVAKHLSGHLPTVEVAWARFLFYVVAIAPVAGLVPLVIMFAIALPPSSPTNVRIW